MKKKKEYRPHIKRQIRELMEKCGGRSNHGDDISITYGKGKFEILFKDRGGIKEGWWAEWFPYTKRSVRYLKSWISF